MPELNVKNSNCKIRCGALAGVGAFLVTLGAGAMGWNMNTTHGNTNDLRAHEAAQIESQHSVQASLDRIEATQIRLGERMDTYFEGSGF